MTTNRCPDCGHIIRITHRPTSGDRYPITTHQSEAGIIRCQQCGCQVKRPLPKIDQRDGPPPTTTP